MKRLKTFLKAHAPEIIVLLVFAGIIILMAIYRNYLPMAQ